MKRFIFDIPNSILKAEIIKLQEEGFEGTDEFWYETRVGYAHNKDNKEFFPELDSVWSRELRYNEIKGAERSLGTAVRKLKKWCEEGTSKTSLRFVKSENRNYAAVHIPPIPFTPYSIST